MKTQTKEKQKGAISKETKIALAFLSKRNVLSDYWGQNQYVASLNQFAILKGQEALQALAGFYLYCVDTFSDDEKKQSQMISSTFAHDLGQMNDEWMLPRSSNYLKYWKKEFADGLQSAGIKEAEK